MSQAINTVWKKCSTCKKDIFTSQNYYVCSVSTCNSRVTQYVFCSVPCWDAHIPIERHRGDSAGAIEKKAPATADQEPPKKRIIASSGTASSSSGQADDDEVLVVASKIRKYINDKSGLNTSASFYIALSEKLRGLCELAIQNARAEGRKTVMDRDV